MTRGLLILALATLLSGGCATITSGPTETITITSDPSGANASVDCEGEKSSLITPARFSVARKTAHCWVTFEKPGFEKQTALLEQGMNARTWWNLPIAVIGVTALGMSGFSNDPDQSARTGGALLVVGLGGFALDAMTSRMRDHDPKTLHVTLRPSSGIETQTRLVEDQPALR